MAYRENAYVPRPIVKKCKCREGKECDWHQEVNAIRKELWGLGKFILWFAAAVVSMIPGSILTSYCDNTLHSKTLYGISFAFTCVCGLSTLLVGITWPALPNWLKSLRDARRNSFEYVEEETE